jgi:phospholipid/cholesterol/gamma-HCH transport system ATP-binding protein
VMRSRVDIMIRQMQDQTPITSLVISHDVGSAVQLADWIVFLHQGAMVFEGKPEDLVTSSHAEVQSFLKAEGILSGMKGEGES